MGASTGLKRRNVAGCLAGRLRPTFLAGCVSALSAAGAVGAQTLVFCSEAAPAGFDPALHVEGATFDASSRQLYDRLTEFVPGTTEVEPGLASSWTVSEDGLEYTFVLRENVAFHSNESFTPTRNLNADDVVFSLDRQRLEEHPFHDVSGGTWRYFDGLSMRDLIAAVERVDSRTVRILLSRPEPAFPANLALDFASVLSAEYADAMAAAGTPELLDQAPVGTGPFELVEMQGAEVRYRVNETYWGDVPQIDSLIFSITPDASERARRLSSGECHIMENPARADIAALDEATETGVVSAPGLDVGYLAFNTTVPPFDNTSVRGAISMAIDRQAILDVVFDGSGRIARNPIPPGIWGHRDETPDHVYDPAAARDLLAAEGIEGLSMQIWSMPIRRPYNPDSRRMAELIAADLEKIGIDVEIVFHDWAEFLSLSRSETREGAVLFGWIGSNGDPGTFLTEALGCDAVGETNRAQWCHRPFDQLLSDARTTTDQETRAELYIEAQAIFRQEMPWAPIAHSVRFVAVRTEVEGYTMDAFGRHIFKTVSLSE